MHNIPCLPLWIVIGDLWWMWLVWSLKALHCWSLPLASIFLLLILPAFSPFFCCFLACIPSNVTYSEQLSMVQPKPDPELLLRHRYSCFWESLNGLLESAGLQHTLHRSLNSVPYSVPLYPTTPLKSRSSSPTHFTMATVKAKNAG